MCAFMFFFVCSRLLWPFIFGGVSALNKQHFSQVNGYPNKYFGWGGEDDDMASR